MVEDEIDLRRYGRALARRWRLIAILPVIAAVVAFGASFVVTPVYEAQVYVAATKFRVEVQLGSQIQTLTEEELAAAGAKEALTSRQARLAAFAALVANPQIAQTVLPQFADRLQAIDERLLDPAYFLRYVKGEGGDESDLIVITVSLPDPQLAAEIANAWAQAYEQFVNQLYSGVRSQDVGSVHQQAEAAYQSYLDAQAELEAYLVDNPAPRLNRRIETLQSRIAGFQDALGGATTLLNDRELAARRDLLEGYFEDLVALQRLLDDAYALQQQLEGGGQSSSAAFGDSLAVILMRSRAFSGAEDATGAPFSLQLQTSLTDGDATASDIADLIEAAESRKAETEARIEELAAALLEPPRYALSEEAGAELQESIEDLTVELQALQAQLEATTARQQDLENRRDLALEEYTALARREVELRLLMQGGGEVRVASLAVPPVSPAKPNKILNAVIAGVAGLALAVAACWAVEWWRGGEEKKAGAPREAEGEGS